MATSAHRGLEFDLQGLSSKNDSDFVWSLVTGYWSVRARSSANSPVLGILCPPKAGRGQQALFHQSGTQGHVLS